MPIPAPRIAHAATFAVCGMCAPSALALGAVSVRETDPIHLGTACEIHPTPRQMQASRYLSVTDEQLEAFRAEALQRLGSRVIALEDLVAKERIEPEEDDVNRALLLLAAWCPDGPPNDDEIRAALLTSCKIRAAARYPIT